MEGTGGKDVLRDCKKNKLMSDERVSYLKRTRREVVQKYENWR